MQTVVFRQHTQLRVGQQGRFGYVVEYQQYMATGGSASQFFQYAAAREFRIVSDVLRELEFEQFGSEPGQQGQHLLRPFGRDLPDASCIVALVLVSVVPDQFGFPYAAETSHGCHYAYC